MGRAACWRAQLAIPAVDRAHVPGLGFGRCICPAARNGAGQACAHREAHANLMRILMLHNRYLVPGGEDQSTAAEVALLRDAGCHVELLERDNRQIEQLGNFRTALRTLWSSESFREVRDKLNSSQFDLLHVQNFFPLWSPAVYYAAAKCRVP